MIIISNPTALANEISTIHSLFENGLELFHVRKPAFSTTEMTDFVNAIGLEFRNRLVLHSHHQLAAELGIERIHFTERERNEISTEILYEYNEKRVHLSTSVHNIHDFNKLILHFEYAFLSPVYPSISKTNYQSETNLFDAIKSRSNFSTQLVALGGISSENIDQTIKAGFDDVALLGTIWNSGQPIKNFELCQQTVLSY